MQKYMWDKLPDEIPFYELPNANNAMVDRRRIKPADLTYPCNATDMFYNLDTRQWQLTQKGLARLGITDKNITFANDISNDVYGVIMHLAPFNYNYHCVNLAQCWSSRLDKERVRLKIYDMLAKQALYIDNNGDVRDWSGLYAGDQNSVPVAVKQIRNEFRHVAPQVLEILQFLGCNYNGVLKDVRVNANFDLYY